MIQFLKIESHTYKVGLTLKTKTTKKINQYISAINEYELRAITISGIKDYSNLVSKIISHDRNLKEPFICPIKNKFVLYVNSRMKHTGKYVLVIILHNN